MKACLRVLCLSALIGVITFLPLGAGDKDKPKDGVKTEGLKVDVVQTFKGHTGEVYSVAFSLDGKLLVTGSFDNTVKLWDAATGKEIKTFAGPQGHTKQVLSVAISPDGQLIASGGADNTLKVWDVPVNRPLRSLPLPDASLAVALSADGTKLAVGGKDGKVRFVNPADFKDLFKVEAGHDGPVTSVAFSPNNALLVSSGVDRTVRFWNAANGQLIALIGAHTGPVNSVAVHPANTAVYSVGDDGFLKFWAFNPIGTKSLPAHAGAIKAMSLSADGASVLTAGEDKVIRQSLTAGKEVRTIPGLTATVRSLAQGSFFAAGTADGKLNLFDIKEGKPAGIYMAHGGAVTGTSFHPSQPQLATAGDDGLVKIWALPPAPARVLTHPDNVQVAAASPDGKKFFTGGADKIIRVWDPAKLTVERQFSGHGGPVTALTGNAATLISGGTDASIRFWNLATGKDAEVLIGHTGTVSSLALNPAGNLLLSGSEDGSVRLWQLPIAAPKPMLHPDQVTCLAVSADGTKMVTGSADKIVRLWNLASAAKERDYPGATLAVTAVAMTPDTKLIAAGSADKSLTIWSNDGKQLQKIALPAPVQSVALSPDGKIAAAGLADGSIKLLGVGDGKEVKTIMVHKGPVTDLAYTPKGDALISASADKTIQVLNAADGAVRSKLDHTGPVSAIALSKDGTRIAAVAEKSVKHWTLADGKETGTFALPAECKGIAFAPDATRLVLAGTDKLARIVELDGSLVESFAHDGPVQGVAFLDAKRVVTGSADKMARLWSSSLLWQRRHAGPVRQVLFSPKGEQAFSGGDDKAIKIFNVPDGKELRSLVVHDGPVVGFAVTPDGTRLATTGADKTAKVWNLLAKPEEFKPTAVFPLPGAPQALALNPAGTRLAIGTAEPQVRVFDLGLNREIQALPDHAAPVKSLVFLGDNRTLLSAAPDKTARLLDVAVLSAFEAHPGGVTTLQFHSGGAQLLTAGKDKTIKLWDLAKSAVTKSFGPFPEEIKDATYSRDFTLVGAALGNSAKAWNPADGKEVVNLVHPGPVLSLAFNQDKTRILTGASDKLARLWDVPTAKELQFFPQEDAVESVAFDPKGLFVVAAGGKTARVDSPAITRQIEANKGPVFSLTVTANSTHVLTGGTDKVAKAWNLATGALEKSFPGGGDIKALAVNKIVQLVATAGPDQVVRVFNFADGKEIGSVKTSGPVQTLTFTPNNLVLAAACADKTIRSWSVPFTPGALPTKDFLEPVQAYETADPVKDLAFAADNATFYAAGFAKSLEVYKLASPTPVANFPHPNLVDCVAFQPAPGGNLLASGGHDGKLRLFDLAKKVLAKEIVATTAKDATIVYAVTFTPDGKQILGGCFDNSLKLFDVGSGALVKEFKAYKPKEFEKGHTEPVECADFSPDGKFLASGSGGLERVIKIWNVGDGSVVRDLANPTIKVLEKAPVQSHPNRVYKLRFAKDGKLISVGDAPLNKGYLGIWNIMDGKMLYGEALPMGCFFGLDVNAEGTLLGIGAGPRGRPSPEFNSAYIVRTPVK